MRIKLTLAYDGTDFRGWAAQRGHRTVQDTVREAIHLATRQTVEVVGASRTDSGAHAKGQVCHFDTEVSMRPEKWTDVLNRVLPGDVAIVSSEAVGEDFHSRFCAEDRFYRYRIRQGSRNPFAGRYAFEHVRKLNLVSMKRAAQELVGTHDFLAFTEELDRSIENTTRTLRRVEIHEHPSPEMLGDPSEAPDEVWIDIVGTAFLRGMMRRMSGALLEVGRGYRPIEDIPKLLSPERNDLPLPVVLPARGLTLMHVRYDNPPRDCRADKYRIVP